MIAPINQENHAEEEEEEEEGYNIKRGLDVFDNIRRALMVCELVVAVHMVSANKVDCFLHEFFSQKHKKKKKSNLFVRIKKSLERQLGVGS